MEKLSLDAINAKSEYYVKKEDDEGTYSFTTESTYKKCLREE